MRRAPLIAIAAVVFVAGCGGTTVAPVAETVVGKYTPPASTQPATPALPKGNAQAGAAVYQSAGCGACHALKAANSNGTVGPNLDDLKPQLAAIESQVIHGGGPMPPYKGQLSNQQIADVSAYVFQSTHG